MADLGERIVLWIRSVPEHAASAQSHTPWLLQIQECIEARHGALEVVLGLNVVASFDGLELEAAVSCARDVLEQARVSQPPHTSHIGLALGEVTRSIDAQPMWYGGDPWDRAQTLAQRARVDEIVFDERAEERAQERFLFSHEVQAERLSGHVLERIYYSKALCRTALARLRPMPLAHTLLPVLDELLQLRARSGQQRVALRACSEAAAFECIERLLTHRPPPLLLWISGNAGCLRPLGSLAQALRRALPDDAALARAMPHAEQQACLQALMHGAAVQRADVVEALGVLLADHGLDGDRPFVVFEQLPEIDPASLALLAEVLMAPDLAAFVAMTLRNEASPPPQLLSAHEVCELRVPALPIEERASVARAVLSRTGDNDDISRRVATLGGPDQCVLAEAIRTFVSSGDLIWQNGAFGWRRGPRQGAGLMPVEALLTERVTGLPEVAYRVLEAICCSPRHVGAELIAAITAHDGLSRQSFDAGLATLLREGWVDTQLGLGASDATLRAVLRNLMPPARAAELHGYAAEVARAHMAEPGFGSGELAYHLFEAGKLAAAASALVEAAHAAMETGFQRMALRLLATAVEWDPSTQIRKAARELARSARPPSPSEQLVSTAPTAEVIDAAAAPENDTTDHEPLPDDGAAGLGQSALRSALNALTRRDFEATERWLDAMLAGGGSLSPALRVLALSHLMRGDPDSAALVLQRGPADETPSATRARDLLCWSLVRLAQGDSGQAIRLALSCLSLARRQPDARGEAAALQVLSFAYRGLDREADALQLEAAAEARLQAHLPQRAAI